MFYLRAMYLFVGLGLSIVAINAQIVFLERPELFNPKFEVAACYVMNKGKILYLKDVQLVLGATPGGCLAGKLRQIKRLSKR